MAGPSSALSRTARAPELERAKRDARSRATPSSTRSRSKADRARVAGEDRLHQVRRDERERGRGRVDLASVDVVAGKLKSLAGVGGARERGLRRRPRARARDRIGGEGHEARGHEAHEEEARRRGARAGVARVESRGKGAINPRRRLPKPSVASEAAAGPGRGLHAIRRSRGAVHAHQSSTSRPSPIPRGDVGRDEGERVHDGDGGDLPIGVEHRPAGDVEAGALAPLGGLGVRGRFAIPRHEVTNVLAEVVHRRRPAGAGAFFRLPTPAWWGPRSARRFLSSPS